MIKNISLDIDPMHWERIQKLSESYNKKANNPIDAEGMLNMLVQSCCQGNMESTLKMAEYIEGLRESIT